MDVRINNVLKEVSEKHGIPVSEIIGKARTKRVVKARADACVILRDKYHMSFEAIGRVFSRSHSAMSIMYRYNKPSIKIEATKLIKSLSDEKERLLKIIESIDILLEFEKEKKDESIYSRINRKAKE